MYQSGSDYTASDSCSDGEGGRTRHRVRRRRPHRRPHYGHDYDGSGSDFTASDSCSDGEGGRSRHRVRRRRPHRRPYYGHDYEGSGSDYTESDSCSDGEGGRSRHRVRRRRPHRRYFMIRSEMHGKVLDIQGGSDEPGADIIMWPANESLSDNQLWYKDLRGNIHSKLNNFCLDSSGGNFKTQPYSSQDDQFWVLSGNRIYKRSDPDRCMDIEGGNDDDGARVCEWNYKGSSNQHWNAQYI